jgi:hypothetical protein
VSKILVSKVKKIGSIIFSTISKNKKEVMIFYVEVQTNINFKNSVNLDKRVHKKKMHFIPQLFYADSESESKRFFHRHYPQKKIFLKTFASERKKVRFSV